MTKTPAKHDGASIESPKELPPSDLSASRIAELFNDEEFKLDWDNDIGHHVARNLQELRRFRACTQQRLARCSGSTQPKVALAESGDANLTLSTLRRYIDALGGRLRFAIEPQELDLPQFPAWWECLAWLPSEQEGKWKIATYRFPGNEVRPATAMAAWRGFSVAAPKPRSEIAGSYRKLELNAGSYSDFDIDSFTLEADAAELLLAPEPDSSPPEKRK